MSTAFEQIKQRLTCVEYARRIGLSINKAGDRCVSPLRSGKNKSSFIVHNDYYYDFGSQQGGDVIDFCSNYEFNGNRSEALHKLADLTGVTLDYQTDDWQAALDARAKLVEKWHSQLRPEDIEYLHSRNINDQTINRLKIGYTGQGYRVELPDKTVDHYAARRICIPYFKNGYIASWNARATTDEQKVKYLKPPVSDNSDRAVIWGMHTLNRTSSNLPLVICEGAFDALSYEQENYPILATMGGTFSTSNREQLPVVLSAAKQFPYVLLSFDNDEAGRRFTISLGKQLFSHRIPFKVAAIPPAFKDVSEYYSHGYSLADLVDKAAPGINELAKRLTDREELKQFCYEAARWVAKPELSDLFSAIRENISIYRPEMSSDYLSELRKSCFSPPNEDIIAKYVAKRHNLRYLANVGFFEYTHGYWQAVDDDVIGGYISRELGSYRTGSKLTSITKLLRTDCVTQEQFNKQPFLSFINGTLDLRDFTFRDHSSSDMLTMQFDFPYVPDAQSEQWNKFIYDVSAGNSKRMALLQEIAGYILYTDCSLQSCAFLLGDGSNGKSVYIETLQSIFPANAQSTIELSGLIEDFKRIQLMNSLVNFGEETSTNVKGAETVFKQVVAGGAISGCFKHKDFVSFTPRTKFIFACNNIPHFKDMSYGLERRMLFVKFSRRFVDNPDPNKPNEMKADRTLGDKLRSDRSAVFNWILDGYKSLRESSRFTVTDDSEDLKQSFREVINPISEFVSEEPYGGYFDANQTDYISNSELYKFYRTWCEETGHHAKALSSFSREFKRLTEDKFTAIHNRSERGYQVKNPQQKISIYNGDGFDEIL